MLGGGAADIVKGGDGNDILYGGAMVDRLECRAGNDLAVVESARSREHRPVRWAASRWSPETDGENRFDGLFGTAHPGKTTGDV